MFKTEAVYVNNAYILCNVITCTIKNLEEMRLGFVSCTERKHTDGRTGWKVRPLPNMFSFYAFPTQGKLSRRIN
jgi:hypothetical protein